MCKRVVLHVRCMAESAHRYLYACSLHGGICSQILVCMCAAWWNLLTDTCMHVRGMAASAHRYLYACALHGGICSQILVCMAASAHRYLYACALHGEICTQVSVCENMLYCMCAAWRNLLTGKCMRNHVILHVRCMTQPAQR